jgi:hypothetical protein
MRPLPDPDDREAQYTVVDAIVYLTVEGIPQWLIL